MMLEEEARERIHREAVRAAWRRRLLILLLVAAWIAVMVLALVFGRESRGCFDPEGYDDCSSLTTEPVGVVQLLRPVVRVD